VRLYGSPLTAHRSRLVTRILGIDPGSQRTGVGIIDVDAAGRTTHVFHAALNLLAADAVPKEDFPPRLKRLLHALGDVVDAHRPDEVAIERVFMARNPDSALKLGQARGAAICAVVMRDLPVHEYAAKEVKLAVVGKGGADKLQVQHMVGMLLNLTGKLQADAADALAVAITHAHVRASAHRLGVDVRLAWSRK
jgi:crossover junction endodeoxyribonuclease RuvC